VRFQILHCGLGVNPVSRFHKENCLVDELNRDAGLESHVSSVQIHMASLDALN
jgi:hypothetical protein